MNLLVLVILAAVSIELSLALYDIKSEFIPGNGKYNVGEEVQLKCTFESIQAIEVGFVTKWYKKQDGEYLQVARDNDVLPPFLNLPGRYKSFREFNRTTRIFLITLDIFELQHIDVGDYKCTAGYPGEEQSESEVFSLAIVPEFKDMSFESSGPSDGEAFLFNIGHDVSCTADSVGLSADLNLQITMEDGTDITQSFKPTSETEWAGELGMRVPTNKHALNNTWIPATAGNGQLNCLLRDGERQLNIQSLDYRRDETAYINCSSNQQRPVKEEDLDVEIRCELFEYNDDTSNLASKWIFLFDNKPVELLSGQTKYLRDADMIEGVHYVLSIPRITKEMVNYGKVFQYKLQVYRTDIDENIAETTYELATDTTYQVRSTGATTLATTTSLLLPLLAML